ncbi:MAG: metallophosphoesterase [Clostridium sp.]
MFDRSIHSYSILQQNQRIIAISDIHANLPVFKKLLKKISYDSSHDELFLVGDLLEKGKYNLDTLHFIMELSKNPHVHPMAGNCDMVCRNILHDYRLDFLKDILMQRKNSIIHEMADQIGITIKEDTDMYYVSSALKKVFLRELTFIDTLPHVIETPNFIFAHAGILNEHTYGNDMRDIMVQDMFLNHTSSFNKYLVVGHLPVSEYRKQICCFNPIIDSKHRVIAIDGGNVVKDSGQLNALLFEKGKFQFVYSDGLPKAQIKETSYVQNHAPFSLTWHESEVKILKKEKDDYYCHHIASKRDIWIPSSFIEIKNETAYAYNYTNFLLPVKKNDYVKIVYEGKHHVLAKKQGLLGWIDKRNIKRNRVYD